MTKLLPYLERVFLATLIVSLIFQLTGNEIPFLMTISLSGLTVTFFLNAFVPIDIKREEGEQMGFNELLGLIILPKILGISSAVATSGILFYTLHLDNDGYQRALYIGGSTIIIASLIMLILKVTGTKHLNATFPLYFRVFPILLVAAYILFG